MSYILCVYFNPDCCIIIKAHSRITVLISSLSIAMHWRHFRNMNGDNTFIVLNLRATSGVSICRDGSKYSDCISYVIEIQRSLGMICTLLNQSEIDENFKPKM